MVVLHVEPDFWGYMEQRASGDNAATVPAKVSETGIAALAGLPSNVSGFARAVVRLRDTYAPNVVLGYHVSVWGTGTDIALQDPADSMVDTLAARAGAFYNSLGANFDIAFGEFSDRDSGFYQYVYGDNGNSWWSAEDFRRGARFLKGFSTAASKRIVMWQIPMGNTKMRAQNNTTSHYQDNRPEWLLDDPFARTSRVVHRRRCRGVPFRRRCRRRDMHLRRAERRRDESGADQRQYARVRARSRRHGAFPGDARQHSDTGHAVRG